MDEEKWSLRFAMGYSEIDLEECQECKERLQRRFEEYMKKLELEGKTFGL